MPDTYPRLKRRKKPQNVTPRNDKQVLTAKPEAICPVSPQHSTMLEPLRSSSTANCSLTSSPSVSSRYLCPSTPCKTATRANCTPQDILKKGKPIHEDETAHGNGEKAPELQGNLSDAKPADVVQPVVAEVPGDKQPGNDIAPA